MPGHKRSAKFGIAGAEIDITEIEGFDNLHEASGALLDIENKLQAIYKSKKSFMLVNGSTVGILSAIYALCKTGDKIIIARNCHKSVYNACMLLKLKVVYIEPEFDAECGYYKGVTQKAVDEAVSANMDAKAVVITSPTYEGYVSEVKCDIPLIIDAAHGAHFGQEGFPAYPKGDIVISSLHKTLPALTQTAVANIYNKELISKFKSFSDIFETSSPSYVLMNSVDICTDYMLKNADEFLSFSERLNDFRSIELSKLRIRNTDDKSKIIISTAACDINGAELADRLRGYGFEPEGVSKDYVILITTVADEQEVLDKLKASLISIDKSVNKSEFKPFKKPFVPNGEQVIATSEISEKTPINEAEGKVSNEFVYAYPPDIPLLAPNEVITADAISYINELIENGVNVISDSSLLPSMLLTKGKN